MGWAKEDNQKMLTKGWTMADPLPEPSPLHCYKTLGDKMCYPLPQAHKAEQLVGEYEPYTPPHKKSIIEKIFLE